MSQNQGFGNDIFHLSLSVSLSLSLSLMNLENNRDGCGKCMQAEDRRVEDSGNL